MKKYLKNTIFLMLCSVIMCSCGLLWVNYEGGATLPTLQSSNANPIIIAIAGSVPIFGGVSSSSVIYVHNNGTDPITGITYTAFDSNTLLTSSLSLNHTINVASAANCASINPGQSCPISFTTASPTTPDFAGSIIIKATYVVNNQTVSFSRVINYETIHDVSTRGVVFTSSVNMYAELNTPAYGVAYAYGSGIGQSYLVNNITSNVNSVLISQGNVTGTNMVSNQIQAIELYMATPPATGTTIAVSLSISSTKLPSTNFTSTIGVGLVVLPSTHGAIIQVGNVPTINISSGTTSGILLIHNTGNATATAITPLFGAGLTANGGTCGVVLASNSSCSIGFTITGSALFGQAQISVGYSNGISSSISAFVNWYSNGVPLLAINASPNPVIFNASTTQNVTITVINIGLVPVSNILVGSPNVTTGSGTASVNSAGNTCAGATLTISSGTTPSCSYVVTIGATAATSGSILFGISGSYLDSALVSQSYSKQINVAYTVAPYVALLTLSIPSFSITGDNVSTQVQTMTVNNVGAAPATLSADTLTNTTGYTASLSGTNCTSPLTAGASCILRTITFGPALNSTVSTISINGINSTFAYSLPYSGGIQGATTANINLNANITSTSVVASNADLSISGYSASNSTSGSGTSASHYIFSGATPTGQLVTVTYKNSGAVPITITGVNATTNNGFLWNIDTVNSTCYTSNVPNAALAVNGTCTVIFKNVISSNFIGLGNIGSIYAMNLTLPEITYTTNSGGSQFQQTPSATSGASIYVDSSQATLVNTVTQSGNGAGSTVTVTNTLANATGYSSIVITSTMEDYFTGAPVMTNCTQNTTTASIRAQICTLTSASVGAGVYTLDSYITAGVLLNVNFVMTSVTPSGAVISFSPTYLKYVVQ